MGNAVKFTERGGVCLSVALVKAEEFGYLRFEVRDSGVGVPPEKRKEIFEEFVQADFQPCAQVRGYRLGLGNFAAPGGNHGR